MQESLTSSSHFDVADEPSKKPGQTPVVTAWLRRPTTFPPNLHGSVSNLELRKLPTSCQVKGLGGATSCRQVLFGAWAFRMPERCLKSPVEILVSREMAMHPDPIACWGIHSSPALIDRRLRAEQGLASSSELLSHTRAVLRFSSRS